MSLIKKTNSLLILLILFSALTGYGQTGKIAGRVTSTDGEPVPFVNVFIVDKNIGSATDIDGYYNIINVRPGEYSVTASAIGFQTLTIRNVRVSIDHTTQVEFELSSTGIMLNEQITVIADKPLVTKDLTASTANISSKDMAMLPVNEFEDVLKLQAGFVGGTVRGGRTGEIVYAIDGVPVTDVYDGSNVIDLNSNVIDELQFISGAFNAEYGKALSAYVNLVTKEAEEKFTGSVTTYFGGHFSNHTNIFRETDQFNLTSIRNFEGTFSGPILANLLSFFIHSRYNYFGGWMNGRRDYNPWDITINLGATDNIQDRYIIQKTGDGKIVSMNWNEKKLFQGKLIFKPLPALKISYNSFYDDNEFSLYDHTYSLNPDGDYNRFQTGATNILSVTHSMNSSSFYQASVSYLFNEYKHYVYKDYNNPRYTNTLLDSQEPTDVPSLNTGGTKDRHFRRFTSTIGGKLDFTSQISRNHMIKTGIEFNYHTLFHSDARLLQPVDALPPSSTGDPFVKMKWPDKNNPDENLAIDTYLRKPIEFSVYIQDKMEFMDLIINAGIRFDAFLPDGQLLTDPTDPNIYQPRKQENIAKTLEERREYWYTKPSNKYQVSPRLGIAFPITDRGVIHVSYGHFFQIPNFQYLYYNQEFKFGTGTGNVGYAGNPDLKPEQSINGEIGLQQALTDEITLDITGFFRDIRNLTGTRSDEIIMYGGSSRYNQYKNTDFGFVRGIVFSFDKRMGNNWSASIDYTLQTAKGNASDPLAMRNIYLSGQRPEMQFISLDVDQTHTVNVSLIYSSPGKWGFSIIGTYGSGLPYTPRDSKNISKLLTNSERKPQTYNVDLRAYKEFVFDNIRLNLFARVNNLFDVLNQLNVYYDTGSANSTEKEYQYRQLNLPELVNTLDEFYRDPSYYSEPRRIEIGCSVYFE